MAVTLLLVLLALSPAGPDWTAAGTSHGVTLAFRDDPRLAVVTKKPVTASQEELERNPRSRSAKLRVARRVPRS